MVFCVSVLEIDLSADRKFYFTSGKSISSVGYFHFKDFLGIGSELILPPTQAFVEDERYAHVTKEMQAELIKSVSEKITSQYDVLARDMVSVVSAVSLSWPVGLSLGYMISFIWLICYAPVIGCLCHYLQARQTEASLQLLRRGARQRGAGGADTSDNISDNLSDKICAQLFLDVQVLSNLLFMESCCSIYKL